MFHLDAGEVNLSSIHSPRTADTEKILADFFPEKKQHPTQQSLYYPATQNPPGFLCVPLHLGD
jgi:hypothetical protein